MQPRLFRKRLIPDEVIELVDDEIVYCDENIIVVKWRTIKSRNDFSHGISCYFLKECYKVGRFFREDGAVLYHYCDIIRPDYDESGNLYVFTDLLFDVVVYDNGEVRVLDLNEGAEALRTGAVTPDELCFALEALQKLLDMIYAGRFGELTAFVDAYG